MKKIALDTNVIIYFLANHEKFGDRAHALFQLIESGTIQALASVITFSEIMTLPLRKKDTALAKKYRELFQAFPNFEFVPLDLVIAEKAAQLRAEHSALKLMDAYILATAWHNEVPLVTEDKALHALKSPIKILTIQDLVD